MKPVVVIVGQPNVGKSTLFNRLTHSRAALVSDHPGLTRDRQYGTGAVGDRPYVAVDTGGIVERLDPRGQGSPDPVLAQTRHALREADAIIFLVDARAGASARDREIANDLRSLGIPTTLVANKAEGLDPDLAVADFHSLGLGVPLPISAAHAQGVDELMARVLAPLPRTIDESPLGQAPQVAVIGRPNAGKSTLINALLGEQRVVVSDIPGTTRDSIFVPIERRGKNYVVIDTAGVRRRARVQTEVEKFSALKTLQALDVANVAILLLDAQAGIGEQDGVLANYSLDRGCSLILAVNKWDSVDMSARAWTARELQRKLAFLEFAEVHFISALKGSGVERLFGAVDRAFASSGKILSTPKLTRALQSAVSATPPPLVRGRRIRLKFAHQGGKRPPVVVVHGSQAGSLPASYRRYLANTFRRAFALVGTPVRIECRTAENPYAGLSSRPRRRAPKQK